MVYYISVSCFFGQYPSSQVFKFKQRRQCQSLKRCVLFRKTGTMDNVQRNKIQKISPCLTKSVTIIFLITAVQINGEISLATLCDST
jgi:hypothetical protein